MAVIAGVFVYGTKIRSDERNRKYERMRMGGCPPRPNPLSPYVVSCLLQPIREGTVSVKPHSQPGGDSPSSPARAIHL